MIRKPCRAPYPVTPTPIPLRSSDKGTILALLEQALAQGADPKVTQRLQWLLFYLEHGSASATCKQFGISRSTFYRWFKRFDPNNLESLTDHPTRPNTEQTVPKSAVRSPLSDLSPVASAKGEALAKAEVRCPICSLTRWLRAPSLRSVTTLVLVAVILNIALLFLVLPVAAGATGVSSWNPALLVNTEAFQTIDDVDTGANIVLRFGESLQESLTYNRSQSQFEFTRALLVHGNLTATGSLEILGTMSGRSLQVTGTGANPLIFSNVSTGRVGIGTNAPENELEVVGTMSGRFLQITGTGASPLIYAKDGKVGIGTTNLGSGGLSVMNGNVGVGTTGPENKLEVVG